MISQPGVLRHLHPDLVRPFIDTAGRVATTWINDQSETNLSHLLGLVKFGLAPALKHGRSSAIARLAAYPNVEAPGAPTPDGRTKDKAKTAKALVEAGYIGKAERALNDESRIAPANEETLAALREKHPVGEFNPFNAPLPPSTPFPDLPEEKDILKGLSGFAADTAPGILGWTVKLARLAAKSPAFLLFLVTLTGQIAAGTAIGQSQLCAARLTPLLKPGGGIRPIAVGELFYRLAMKAIFATSFRHDFLGPNQFGVGSKGGVEPIIHAVQRAADSDPLFPFTHLFSLDSVNAFNALLRRYLASSTAKYAPHLQRLAAWAHNLPSPLLIRSPGGVEIIESSNGVRQGDPMSTLWYSMSIRDAVKDLQDMLGPEYLVLAYLDDIFVLAPSAARYGDVLAHFATPHSPMRLNPDKSQI
jgi:hypothetical protein